MPRRPAGSSKERKAKKPYSRPAQPVYTGADWQKMYGPRSSMNQQAMRTGGWANPSVGGELKFIDVSSNSQTVATASSAWSAGVLLNGVAPGSGADQRIGRKITMKSLLLRYSIDLNALTGGSSKFRILVVYDKQTNATAPAITDILLADAWHSPNNLSNRDRFVTLADEFTDICGSVGDCTDPSGMLKFKKLNLETMFNAGNAGTVADMTSGSVYIFFSQSGNLTFTTSCTLTFRSRIRFTDV